MKKKILILILSLAILPLISSCKSDKKSDDKETAKEEVVVEKEVAGYRIIADLLDVFVTALNNHQLGIPTNYDRLLLNILPKEFIVISPSPYKRIMSICTYVSRMSDSYAIRIHKKIKGSIL